MTENITDSREKRFASSLLQKLNELDIKSATRPLLKFADEHPIATLFIAILSGLAMLPLLLFFTFAAMTFMFTLFGFLLIEGTLLSIATVMLTITLFGVVCASFIFTALLVSIWFAAATSNFGVQKLKNLIQAKVPLVREARLFEIDHLKGEKKAC